MTQKKWIIALICILSVLLFIWMAGLRYQLGLVRYFDPDEFMYPHWAHNIFLGQVPYRDFFIFVTPGYLLFLAPLFWLGQGIVPVVLARTTAWGISVFLALLLGAIYWRMRKSWVAVLVPVLFFLLPVPSDKLLEIRPDTLATFLAMFGLLLSLRTNFSHRILFLSGLSYGLSLLVLQKLLPNVLVGSVVVSIMFRKRIRTMGWFVLGLGLPFALFIMWTWTSGSLDEAMYFVTRGAVEHAKAVGLFNPIPIDFYFRPNSIYFGSEGYSLGFVVNSFMWVIAFIVACIQLISICVFRKRQKHAGELLIPLLFLVQIVLYVFSYPLKFPQYLIPAAVLVPLLLADGIGHVWKKVGTYSVTLGMVTALLILGLWGAMQTFRAVTLPKFVWTNAPHLGKMKMIFSAIPMDEYVLDLEGRTTYYRDPYYICCLPFGQFAPYLSRPLPSLSAALQKTKTKYIYQAELPRIENLLLDDIAFIKRYYTPTHNKELWVATEW